MKDRVKIIGLMLLSLALVAGAGTDVEEGNKLYHDGKYGEAMAKYSEAQAAAPEAPGIYFDIGNVYYMQEDYGKALDLYKKAAAAEDPAIESSAYYNMGNAKYRLGKGESSIPIYEEAIGNYSRALTFNPGDVDAKNNLEYVRREIEKLKNQQQQQQQKQDEEKKEEDQEK
ncbi:MAG: tetratricopeptide repeat protein, partial [Candidatus Tritonobacter lacicola]|nr:tetratricopeptide repeat protein [Candidatus Tritonobacter lacicola]